MESMRRSLPSSLVIVAGLLLAAALVSGDGSAVASASDGLPGSAAPPEVVAEIHRTVDAAVARFDAMDLAGVLEHVSYYYKTGSLTRGGIEDQLRAVFALHDQVRTRVRIDDVRMVGELVWVYSSGEVTGRIRILGRQVFVASWERELEVGRLEDGRWRLYGYQK
jgi:hypothetical protein